MTYDGVWVLLDMVWRFISHFILNTSMHRIPILPTIPLSDRHLRPHPQPKRTPSLELRDPALPQPRRTNNKLLPFVDPRHARHACVGELVRVGVPRLHETRHGARVARVRERIASLDGIDLIPLRAVLAGGGLDGTNRYTRHSRK